MKLLSVSDIEKQKYPCHLVEYCLPQNGLVLIYGNVGTGKSFLALDLALLIANGDINSKIDGDGCLCDLTNSWFGMWFVYHSRPVFFLPYTGRDGLPCRIQAWKKKIDEKALENTGHKAMLSDNFMVFEDNLDLLNETTLDDLIKFIPDDAVIFIDPVYRAFPCIDADPRIVNALDKIRIAKPNVLIVGIVYTKHLFSYADAIIKLKKIVKRISQWDIKTEISLGLEQKEATPEEELIKFELVNVSIGETENGELVDSCYIQKID